MNLPGRFAMQARALCPETPEHHNDVWFCPTCKALERRLTPISDLLPGVLSEAELQVRWPA